MQNINVEELIMQLFFLKDRNLKVYTEDSKVILER
jgi:hypothetical protein